MHTEDNIYIIDLALQFHPLAIFVSFRSEPDKHEIVRHRASQVEDTQSECWILFAPVSMSMRTNHFTLSLHI